MAFLTEPVQTNPNWPKTYLELFETCLKLIWFSTSVETEAEVAELGESLNHILTRLEDIGIDGIPPELEIDLRHVMNLESPANLTSRLIDITDDDLEDDLLENPFGLSPEDCSQMAQLFRSGSISGGQFPGGPTISQLSGHPGGDSKFDDTTRFFQLDEDFKSAVEPFMLLPDRLSLNRDLSGLDQADIVKLEQEIRNRDLSGLDQADIDRLEQEIRSKWGVWPTMKK